MPSAYHGDDEEFDVDTEVDEVASAPMTRALPHSPVLRANTAPNQAPVGEVEPDLSWREPAVAPPVERPAVVGVPGRMVASARTRERTPSSASSARFKPLAIGLAALAGLLLLGGLAALLGGGRSDTPALAAATVTAPHPVPAHRVPEELRIGVTGPAVAAYMDGKKMDLQPGGLLADLLPGPHSLVLVSTPDCGVDDEPVCGGCCACTEHKFEFMSGTKPAYSFAAPDPSDLPTREVVVTASGIPDDALARLWVGDIEGVPGEGREWSFDLAVDQTVEFVATHADCQPSDCEGAACDDCRVGATKMVLSCGDDPVEIGLAVDWPEEEGAEPPTASASVRAAPTSPKRKTSAPVAARKKPLVSTSATVLSGRIDEELVRAGVQSMSSSVKSCWLAQGHRVEDLGKVVVDFKIRVNGSVDASSVKLVSGTGFEDLDGCAVAAAKGLDFGKKAKGGKARATVWLRVH